MADDLLEMSVNLVTAHLAQNRMSANEVPEFLKRIHATLRELKDNQPIEDVSTITRSEPIPSPAAKIDAAAETVDNAGDNNADTHEVAPQNPKVAYQRDNDLSDPVFQGLDPWLAARISMKTASKLDPDNAVHPSVHRDKLICLEDGADVKLLRSYIKKRFGLTPSEYIEKWNLPDDFPMAPPEFVENKRKLALKGGLGRKVRANREKPRSQQKTEESAGSSKAKEARPSNSESRAMASDDRAIPSAKSVARNRNKLSLFSRGGRDD